MLKMSSLLNIVVKLRNNERSRPALRNVGSVIIGGGGAERRVEVKGERARRGAGSSQAVVGQRESRRR